VSKAGLVIARKFVVTSVKPARRSVEQDDGHNHAVESNGLGENENEDHADEDTIGLGVGSNTSITSNTNSESGSEGAETAAKSS